MSTMDPDSDPRELLAAQIAWLESADRDEWHRVMLDFNWGEPLNLLHWIATHPDCDLGTALTMFWLGQPAAWLAEADDFAAEEPDEFSWLNAKICADIAHRVAAGSYARAEIAFTPDGFTKKDYAELLELTESLDDPTFPVPRALITSQTGRTVENDLEFYGRYPQHLRYSTPMELPDFPEWRQTEKKLQRIEKKALRGLPRWLRKA